MADQKLQEVKLRGKVEIGRIYNPMNGTGKLVNVLGVSAKKHGPIELTCLFNCSINAQQEFEILKMKAVNLESYVLDDYEVSYHDLGDYVLKVRTKL